MPKFCLLVEGKTRQGVNHHAFLSKLVSGLDKFLLEPFLQSRYVSFGKLSPVLAWFSRSLVS